MNSYKMPALGKSPKLKKKQIQLIASGDLRLSANQKCWPAQEQMESALSAAVESMGFQVVRAHPYKPDQQHGFIASQREEPTRAYGSCESGKRREGLVASSVGDEERRVENHAAGEAGFKLVMLRRAFNCGIRRVEFRVDRRNARSQAAMKKLGAVREGVLRADRITWNGHVRDTVLFAILADEWPV